MENSPLRTRVGRPSTNWILSGRAIALISFVTWSRSAFASTGDPNHEGAPSWPEAGDGALLALTNDGPVAVTDDPWRSRLDAVRRLAEAR